MKNIISLLILISLLMFVTFNCTPQEEESAVDTNQLDNIIENYLENNNVPGAEVLIAKNGEIEYHEALGVANLENDQKREPGQQFRIASISKTFTALRILQMHDENIIELDNTIAEYFPDFPNAHIITIRHLLNMNAGIPDFADNRFLEEWHDDLFMDFSMEKAVELSAEKEDDFIEPGEKVIYSNINYTLLGLIIEQETGSSIQEEFNNHIFRELNLQNTAYPSDTEIPGELRGYSRDDAEGKFLDVSELNPEIPHTGGAIISNMPDLKVFIEALYSGSLLSEETHREQMQTLPFDESPEWMRYGLGILDMGGFWGHNGTIFGFSSELYYYPPEDTTIIINVNRSDKDDQSHSFDLFMIITDFLFPDELIWHE